jgi:murein DD-endopeptidase MepM/ murein hydrolase activator NlpD
VVTAPFGDLRLFNGKKQSQHFGVDLDGSTGDPIEAANDGTVVMVRECYASGNTVIVNHGAGLYTLYFHMSHFDVQPGDKVKQGQLLGRVGKTGRVTGPHLHWSGKIDGLYVDAQALMKLDFTP